MTAWCLFQLLLWKEKCWRYTFWGKMEKIGINIYIMLKSDQHSSDENIDFSLWYPSSISQIVLFLISRAM